MVVLAAGSGGVKIQVNAENFSTADADAGAIGDRLKVKVSDSSGTDFTSLTGNARYTPVSGPVQIFNIDESNPIGGGPNLGMIELTDSGRPGDQIFIGLGGTLEVRVHFAGGTAPAHRFSSGLDQLGLKIGIK